MQIEKALTIFLNSKRSAKSANTVKWYTSKLNNLVTWMKENQIITIESVKIFDLEEWSCTLTNQQPNLSNPHKPAGEETISTETRRGYIRAARAWFKWLHQRAVIKTNPTAALEMPRKSRVRKTGISPELRDRILDLARPNPRNYALLRFLAATGCRLGGIATLTLDRVDLANRRAVVIEKGDKSRPVYYDPETAHALASWLVSRPDTATQHIFVGYKKGGRKGTKGLQPITGKAIYEIIARYAKRIPNAEGWNPHNWRHGAARTMTKRGMPLQTLTQILGHSSEQVTADIYGSLDEQEIQAMYEKFGVLD